MKLLRFATFVLLALAALLVGGAGQADAVDGGISGRVTDEFGNPIEDAWVEAFQIPWDDQGATATDSDGIYTIDGLTPGSYRMWVTASGYVDEFYDDTTILKEADPVTVAEGTVTPDIDIALSGGGSISGRVTDETGTPIAGAYVDAIAEVCCSFGVTTTAADGTYTVDGISGSYFVFASASGFASEYYDDTIDTSLATPVTVGPGTNTPNINFALSPCNTSWSQPAGDDDCDGFETESEKFSGTDPMKVCSADAIPNNESPDAWPPDFDDDQTADIFDVLDLKPHFNNTSPDPGYSARHDVDADSDVDIFDALEMKPYFNESCTP